MVVVRVDPAVAAMVLVYHQQLEQPVNKIPVVVVVARVLRAPRHLHHQMVEQVDQAS